jgi:cyclopropane fatty-acyl-phospholipid synthase-like methyltransferase
MTEIELIIDLHKNAERQGPGSTQDTLQALEFVNLVDDREMKILDIGCGSGGQTITLAKNLTGQITAVDLFPEFLEALDSKSEKLGLIKRISTLKSSMDDLNFEKGEFDLIWSEGAIYIMGFEKGIENWKHFLVDGGYLAVSEMTWISNQRPEEIENFWNVEYPEIDTASNKIKILEENGFTLTGYFVLPRDSWLKNYYEPLESNFESFLKRNNYSDLARQIVAENQTEIELYKKFNKYFSYGFYIAQKTG